MDTFLAIALFCFAGSLLSAAVTALIVYVSLNVNPYDE